MGGGSKKKPRKRLGVVVICVLRGVVHGRSRFGSLRRRIVRERGRFRRSSSMCLLGGVCLRRLLRLERPKRLGGRGVRFCLLRRLHRPWLSPGKVSVEVLITEGFKLKSKDRPFVLKGFLLGWGAIASEGHSLRGRGVLLG